MPGLRPRDVRPVLVNLAIGSWGGSPTNYPGFRRTLNKYCHHDSNPWVPTIETDLSGHANGARDMRCNHRSTEIRTEADGCHWVACKRCSARGPKRHSVKLAKSCAVRNIRVR